MKGLLTLNDISTDKIREIIDLALEFKHGKSYKTLKRYEKEAELVPYMLLHLHSVFKEITIINPYVYFVINFLKDYFEGEKAIILGPISPFISLRNGTYEKQVLVKYKKPDVAREIFTELFNTFKFKSNIEISINIDSYNL